MGGFFGVASKNECVLDLFYGVDYHSHLGTRRGGMATHGENGFSRAIHNIENSPFRTKFDKDLEELKGNLGIGCISDFEPQPLLIQSHLGSFAITTVGKINNLDSLLNMIYNDGHSHFQEMSTGQINATELVASLICKKDSIVEGIRWRNNGGLTISGGEPLRQMDFVSEVFRLAHAKKVQTALDTSAQPFAPDDAEWMARFDKLLENTDLVILDLKEIDDEKHKKLTGHSNKNILAMAQYVAARGVDLWIRHVLVPGLTDDADGLRALDAFIKTLPTVRRVEILPYHTLGLFKWQNLGIPYPLDGVRVPTAEEIAAAEQLLHVQDYPDAPKD